jgi:peptidyl-prolyl cis-trans isomerase D
VRDTLVREVLQAERERAFNDMVGAFVDQVYRNPTELASAAKEANLEVHTAGPFARGEAEGVVATPAVQRAAFSESLIQDGTASDPIEIDQDRSVVIRVTSHEPARAMTVAEARERIVAAIRADRARKRVEAEADAMLAEVAGGKTLKDVADARSLQLQDIEGMPRGAPIPSAAAAEAYFKAPVPAEGAVSTGKVALDDGGVVVYAVEKVTPGDPAEAQDAERDMFREQMAGLLGREDAETLLRELRAQMRITISEAQL